MDPTARSGKTVLLFQTPRTIVGVVENFYNQPLIREPNSVIHPSVLMPATGSPILIAKLDGITPEKLSEIRKLLTNLFPSTDITVDIYRSHPGAIRKRVALFATRYSSA